MAESLAVAVKERTAEEELEEEFTCSICQEHYTEPKLLPCFHYFCEKCILWLVQAAGPAKPVSCPECRSDVSLTDQKVNELMSVSFVTRLKTNTLAVSQGKNKSIESFKQCEEHRELLIIHCFDCNCLICHCCASSTHEDHNYELCSKASPAVKRNLQESLKLLHECKSQLTRAIAEIKFTKEECNSQEKTLTETVKASFKELRAILDQGKCKLLAKIAGEVEMKTDKLSMQEKNLSVARGRFQTMAKYVEKCIEHSTSTELMTMQADLKKQVQSQIEMLKSVSKYERKPDVKVDTLYQRQMEANVKAAILNKKCVTLINTGKAEVGKVSKASLTIKTGVESKWFQRNFKVTSKLVSIRAGDALECQVDSSTPDGHSIQFTPTVRGRHKLNVLVNEKEVVGSPFSVFVLASLPSKLENAVSVWQKLTSPVGVAVNSKNEVLVALYSSIIRFDREWRRKTLVKLSYQLCGLLVDQNDNIYCKTYSAADRNLQTCVLKISSSGAILCYVQLMLNKYTGLDGSITFLSAQRTKLLVCTRNYRIYSFYLNLQFERYVCDNNESKSYGRYSAASSDSLGNIYCAGTDISCIQVFNNQGVYLHCFDGDRYGTILLNKPNFVHVLDQYVYVTNSGDFYNLFVFTTDGEYLYSYHLPHPFLGVDVDGYIYGSTGNAVYRY